MIRIIIPGDLPTLNQIIDASKSHWSVYRTMKQDNTNLIALLSKRHPQQEKVNAIIHWFRKDQRFDKDNIMAGQKFIWDGLKEAGVIGNDGWKHIGDVLHRFDVDKKNPRVEIELYPASRYELHYEVIDRQKVVQWD